MQNDLPIYVINLDDSVDRLEEFSRSLADLDLDFTRISAFDGRKINALGHPDYDDMKMRRAMGRSLSGGELGCLLSHRIALSEFVASGESYALILEDDACLISNFERVFLSLIIRLNAFDPAWRVVNLGHPSLKIKTDLGTFNVDDELYTLVAAHYYPMGAFSLLWSRRGASEYLEHGPAISRPYDNDLQNWLCRAGGGFAVSPPLAFTADSVSVIDATPRGGRPARGQNQRGILYGFRKQRRLWGNKIWAIYHKLCTAVR